MRASVATMPRSGVVGERRLDDLAQGPSRQRVARARRRRPGSAHVARGAQRLEHRREDPLGERGHPPVEVAPPGVLAVSRRSGRAKAAAVAAASPWSTSRPRVGSRRHRREGGVPAPDEPHVEVEVGDHLPRQQRDEVGVARQPRVDALEGLGGHGRAADVVRRLEDEDAPARPARGRRRP